MTNIEQQSNPGANAAKLPIPAQYLLEDGSVMPADIIKELYSDQPGTSGAETRARILAEVQKAENDREVKKEQSIALEYGVLTEKEKAGFKTATQLAGDLLGRAIKGENMFDDLSVEENTLLVKTQIGYRQAKTEHPNSPININFSQPIDKKIYANLINRIALGMVKPVVEISQPPDSVAVAKSETKLAEGETEFSHFNPTRGESHSAPGLYYDQYYNTAAESLKAEGKFEWGKERIYFEVLPDQFQYMTNLTQRIAGEQNIPIAFKHMDMDKTAKVNYDETRFVANFANAADAKRFYEAIAQDQGYRQIKPDRQKDYLGHQLDPVATYANGFRESRAALKAIIETAVQAPDNAYTYTATNGRQITIPEADYLFFNEKYKQMPDAKEAWEKA